MSQVLQIDFVPDVSCSWCAVEPSAPVCAGGVCVVPATSAGDLPDKTMISHRGEGLILSDPAAINHASAGRPAAAADVSRQPGTASLRKNIA